MNYLWAFVVGGAICNAKNRAKMAKDMKGYLKS